MALEALSEKVLVLSLKLLTKTENMNGFGDPRRLVKLTATGSLKFQCVSATEEKVISILIHTVEDHRRIMRRQLHIYDVYCYPFVKNQIIVKDTSYSKKICKAHLIS